MKFDVKLLLFLLIATAMVFIFGAKKFLTKRHPNFSHQRINENFNCSQEACDRTFKAMIKESIRNLTIEKNYFAVLSSDFNIEFLFPLPIVVLGWRRLGVQSVIILIGSKDIYWNQPQRRFILQTLSQMETVRVFSSGLQNLPIDDDSLLITADADILTLKLDKHIPENANEIFSYNYLESEENRKQGKSKDSHQYSLNTIAMTAKLWREIIEKYNFFGINQNWLINGDVLAVRLYKELGGNVTFSNGGRDSALWKADQIITSSKIDEWLQKSSDNRKRFRGYPGPVGRIDRHHWIFYNNFQTIDMKKADDVHLPRPLDKEWQRILPLLERIFTKGEFNLCNRYHQLYTKIIPS